MRQSNNFMMPLQTYLYSYPKYLGNIWHFDYISFPGAADGGDDNIMPVLFLSSDAQFKGKGMSNNPYILVNANNYSAS